MWKVHLASHIEALLKFANAYLHEDACILVLLHEVKEIRHDVMTYVETYDFIIVIGTFNVCVCVCV